ncbi:iron chelate uptake ABC transporter family permease subunit [Agrobacterium sp. AGB01]|uniref:iron chelate uptake ABC transporter family permease subunit n=1 Tax=Agrobacterium sp. AGB01 TaxID=2769302 RepID=UPI0017862136|nr:iron chelate uptake ABC transporter family permease subunit [Agrobacterium sp. AGB01]MBD9389780.1 iron chelate uptake ABC transporter family permease subunit [Agrobacterium sp. AGB01]
MATGAILMAVADLVGRSIIAPLELPAGVVTAVLGAPFFCCECAHRHPENLRFWRICQRQK